MTQKENNPEVEQEEQNDDVDVEESEVEDTPDTNDDGEEINWKKEALKNKAILARKEEKLKKLQQAPKEAPKEAPEAPSDLASQYQTIQVVKDLTEDEFEELSTKAKELGVSEDKLVRSPMWKTHLDGLRTQKRQEKSTPDPTRKTVRVAGKDIGEMTPAEKKANWDTIVGNYSGRGSKTAE